MRFSVLAAISGLSTLATAQTLNDLPGCAKNCVGNTLASTGCNLIDITCICKSSGWIAGLSCCIANSCPPADQATTIQFADQICKTANVVLPSQASCAASSGPTSASTVASTGSSAAAAALGSTAASSKASSIETGVAGGSGSSSIVSGSASSNAAAGTTSGTPTSATNAPASASTTATSAAAANAIGLDVGAAGFALAALALL